MHSLLGIVNHPTATVLRPSTVLSVLMIRNTRDAGGLSMLLNTDTMREQSCKILLVLNSIIIILK